MAYAQPMRIYVTTTRYYAVGVQLDPFGEAVIVQCCGSRRNNLGCTATEPFSRERLHEIAKEQRAHDYWPRGHASDSVSASLTC